MSLRNLPTEFSAAANQAAALGPFETEKPTQAALAGGQAAMVSKFKFTALPGEASAKSSLALAGLATGRVMVARPDQDSA